jgi:mannose-6-phosphate isomerase-like protein (cupin superfamily)
MISRIERAESSPTAALLVRLGSGLGLTLSALFDEGPVSGPLVRQTAQPVWRDPASGYLRRNVSARGTGSGFEIVEVVLPPGAHVVLDSATGAPPLDQQVWVLEGALDLTLGETRYQLAQGDCLQMHLRETISYRNAGSEPVRYAVILAARSGTFPGHAV